MKKDLFLRHAELYQYDDFLLVFKELEKCFTAYYEKNRDMQSDILFTTMNDYRASQNLPDTFTKSVEWESIIRNLGYYVSLFSPVRNDYHYVVLGMILMDAKKEILEKIEGEKE